MEEPAFRSYLATRLSARSAHSYVSNCRRVQRVLGIDLDTADLSEIGLSNIRRELEREQPATGMTPGSLSDCISAVRSYAAYLLSRNGAPVVQSSRPASAFPPLAREPARENQSASPVEAPTRPSFIGAASIRELLVLHGQIMDELREREIVRTGNGPVGDYAEVLFSRAFGWRLEPNSAAGYDATDGAGVRYQIKARRVTRRNPSRQLGALRRLPDRTFDVLAGVLLNESYAVSRAILIPYEVIAATAKHVAHTNSWRFMLEDRVWSEPGVRDVTPELVQAASDL